MFEFIKLFLFALSLVFVLGGATLPIVVICHKLNNKYPVLAVIVLVVALCAEIALFVMAVDRWHDSIPGYIR